MPNKKEYFPELCNTPDFFVPHKDSNHLNAQDVVHNLIARTLSASTVTWLMFEDRDGKMVNIANDDLVADMLFDIQTKLEMIKKILPLAFKRDEAEQENKKVVTL